MGIRRQPHVFDRVTVVYLASAVPGLIERVEEDGRRLIVSTGAGERVTFALNRATGHFTEHGQLVGARLRFDHVSPT